MRAAVLPLTDRDEADGDDRRPGTRTSLVHEQLRRDIVEGSLPPGEKLRIEALRERYEVGASPLREALNRLSAEGLVTQQDQKGFRVSPVSPEELLELTRTRCWVNEIALRESIATGDAAWEEHVLIAYHRLTRTPSRLDGQPGKVNPAWQKLHQAFHASLYAGCPSRWLIDFANMLGDRADRYRYLSAATQAAGKRDVPAEHKAIMEAVIGRRTDDAIRLVNEHLVRTTQTLLGASPGGAARGRKGGRPRRATAA